jgi:predicted peptidase
MLRPALFALSVAILTGHPQTPMIVDDFEAGRVRLELDGVDRSLPYRLLRPESADAANPLPLLVFLHGAGERGDDNELQLRHFPERWIREPHLGGRHDAFLLAVQCPQGGYWAQVEHDAQGRWTTVAHPERTDSMAAVEALLRDLAQDPAVDRRRIYVTGLSMWGFGTWDLAARHPHWFAAALPICGGADLGLAAQLADSRLPIWAFHGSADDVVPPELSRDLVSAIRSSGGSAGYTELRGVAHDSWNFAYGPTGGVEWLFAQAREEPAVIPPR